MVNNFLRRWLISTFNLFKAKCRYFKYIFTGFAEFLNKKFFQNKKNYIPTLEGIQKLQKIKSDYFATLLFKYSVGILPVNFLNTV